MSTLLFCGWTRKTWKCYLGSQPKRTSLCYSWPISMCKGSKEPHQIGDFENPIPNSIHSLVHLLFADESHICYTKWLVPVGEHEILIRFGSVGAQKNRLSESFLSMKRTEFYLYWCSHNPNNRVEPPLPTRIQVEKPQYLSDSQLWELKRTA